MSRYPSPCRERYAGTSREPGIAFLSTSTPSYGPGFNLEEVHDDLDLDNIELSRLTSSLNDYSHNQTRPITSPASLPSIMRPSSIHGVSELFTHSPNCRSLAESVRSQSTTPRRLAEILFPPSSSSPIENNGLTQVDCDLTTRNWCVLALVLGWVIAFVTLTLGIYIIVIGPIEVPSFLLNNLVAVGSSGYSWVTIHQAGVRNPYLMDHRVYHVPEAVMVIASLFLTFALTTIFDSMNFIHATSLRWALWREGTSLFNSNLRLFTCSKHHIPNQWPANVISSLGLFIAYGGVTLLIRNVYVVARLVISGRNADFDFNVSGPRYGIDFNAWGLIGIGVGTLLQAIVSTFCLVYRRGLIPAWSSNPLATALACRSTKVISPYSQASIKAGTFNSGISSSNTNSLFLTPHSPTQAEISEAVPADEYNGDSSSQRSVSRPRTTQPSAGALIPRTRRMVDFTWILFGIFALFAIIVAILGQKLTTTSGKAIGKFLGHLDPLSYLQNLGQIGVRYNKDPYQRRLGYAGLIIQSAVLSLVLANLHLAEMLTLLVRDEKIWRKATTRGGVRLNSSTLVQAVSVWQCWVMFAFKGIIPWVLSYGFICSSTGVYFTVIPLSILAILFLLLAVFSETLIRWKPKGSQPSTYGNMPALLYLVDEWDHEILYWGEKCPVLDGFGKAGTSGSRLADVKPNGLYIRLKADIRS